jgi:hypothetical protein
MACCLVVLGQNMEEEGRIKSPQRIKYELYVDKPYTISFSNIPLLIFFLFLLLLAVKAKTEPPLEESTTKMEEKAQVVAHSVKRIKRLSLALFPLSYQRNIPRFENVIILCYCLGLVMTPMMSPFSRPCLRRSMNSPGEKSAADK